MKKYIYPFLFLIVLFFSSCQMCTRTYGGDMTIKLEPGEKLIMATWKNNNLWYLTEQMDSDYIPKTKVLKESSLFGVMEGTVTFVETR